MRKTILAKKFLLEPLPKMSEIVDITMMKMMGKRYYLYTAEIDILEGMVDAITNFVKSKKFVPAGKMMLIERVELTYLPSGDVGRGRPNKLYEQPEFFAILNLGPNTRRLRVKKNGGTNLEPGDMFMTQCCEWEILKSENEKESAGIMIYKGKFADCI